ncbi:hydantoinase/oxoprolinase family protein [Paraburkholderia sp. J41]|uniref:hydantoinase/oxoprolinase family protein n=1 Tax=Paraburkholderia sp. J41 TaxID=2805433 RepID=UPI002AC35CE0|nr:hydantoinase/oxoprolinase family protein [Paraburkholderia sp. J41]
MVYKISVDTGGTFTDVVVSDESGSLTIGKALTTRSRIFVGMKEAIGAAATLMGISLEELLTQTSMLIYGTTRATNAIVTKATAKTALITTRGFPDILLMKEGGKLNPHDFTQDYPEPYLPRRHTFEITERVGPEGCVIAALDEAEARTVIEQLRARGFEAAAVCFLWSISNPAHEQRFGELLSELAPEISFTLSHRLVPIVREYRRASATAIDASLKPLMQRHLRELEEDLRAAGFAGHILVSTASGGCNHVDGLIEKPIYTIGSGPAMAPIAGLTFSSAERLGSNVIICDTGGTTFDVGLVRDGRLTFSRDTWLGPAYTGDLLGISAVDMRSIGAGGGSIAWIDEGGLMRVGPQSAGSEPGPACYGRGGTEPTVSDAAVVLGYFDPDYFLGGRMALDVVAAKAAVGKLAAALKLSVEETAFQIMSLASDLMVRAIADVTINEGVNPRESTIVAGGGAAGINIMAIAKELGCEQVVLPKVASALSASGMQFANIVAEETASLAMLSDTFDRQAINTTLRNLENRLEDFRAELPDQSADYHIEFVAEARYQGQVWELDTPLARPLFETDQDVKDFVAAFHLVHERVFAVRDEGSQVEVVNWKARMTVSLASTSVSSAPAASAAPKGRVDERNCFFGGVEPILTQIYKEKHIFPGLRIEGPAIIEEPTTTLVVNPGMAVSVSAHGNYLLHISK